MEARPYPLGDLLQIVHYAELRKLLIDHASLLARRIDWGEHITASVTVTASWRM